MIRVIAIVGGTAAGWLVAGLATSAERDGTAAGVSPDPLRWQAAIDGFARADEEQEPPVGANLFVGSSSIHRWPLSEHFSQVVTINRGFGGSHIADVLHYFDRLVSRHRPRVVVVYAGDNDVAYGKSASVVASDFERLRRTLHQRVPNARLVYIGIKPSRARWHLADTMREANTAIAASCATDELCEFVDVWSAMLDKDGRPNDALFVDDGLHLSPQGYQLWAGLVRPHLVPSGSNGSRQPSANAVGEDGIR